jgi:hypothetical protein
MARLTALYPALIGLALVALFPMMSVAQSTTDVTFKDQVQVPGAVLPPGVYHFTLSKDRKTVSISDANHRIVKTVRVIEVSREKNGPRVTMRPSGSGAPPEVAGFYSTGSTRGVEFIYTPAKE